MNLNPQQRLIHLDKVNKYYETGDTKLHVLRDVSLDIYHGEFVSIMGPSGSGKSTLINVLGFLDNKFDGQYLYQDEPVNNLTDNQISHLRNEMVGFVFQEFNLIEAMTVQQNVALPLLYRGLSHRETIPHVENVLNRVGLGNKMKVYPKQLSGGQRQRVAIARALVNNPKFIIADEPTGALDTKTSEAIMRILQELNREGSTIVMVTHDPGLQDYANKHIVIVDGQVSYVNKDEAVSLIEKYRMHQIEEEE